MAADFRRSQNEYVLQHISACLPIAYLSRQCGKPGEIVIGTENFKKCDGNVKERKLCIW